MVGPIWVSIVERISDIDGPFRWRAQSIVDTERVCLACQADSSLVEEMSRRRNLVAVRASAEWDRSADGLQGGSAVRVIGCAAFDVEAGEDAVEPGREPPVCVAGDRHDRGNQDQADDGDINEDRRCKADAELLDCARITEHEGREDG